MGMRQYIEVKEKATPTNGLDPSISTQLSELSLLLVQSLLLMLPKVSS